MSNVVSTGAVTGLSWDGEGRRVSGGALAPDLPAAPGEEVTFSDFLSVINPLQHIPVVSSIYRWVTGDTIKPAARVVGGALYGGPIGLVSAVLNAVVEEVKGSDIGAQVLAMVTPDKPPAAEPKMAAAEQAKPEAATQEPPADAAADANLAALQQFAADLRQAAQEPEPAKKTEEPPAAVPILPGQARTLAYYQANAGRRLPTSDGNRYALSQPQGGSALAHTTSSMPPAAAIEAASKSELPAAGPGEAPPSAWFTSAMQRGLDRYRTMQQLEKGPPQVDLTH
jgi:hypothetical protein